MGSVLVDTNVLLDVLIKREPFVGASKAALLKAVESDNRLIVAVSQLTDIFYIIKRQANEQTARKSVLNIQKQFEIVDVYVEDGDKAIRSAMPDFEDALLDRVAARNGASLILTRNTVDFEYSEVLAMSPDDYLA
jgi:predicted nucleic acid-binding protein